MVSGRNVQQLYLKKFAPSQRPPQGLLRFFHRLPSAAKQAGKEGPTDNHHVSPRTDNDFSSWRNAHFRERNEKGPEYVA